MIVKDLSFIYEFSNRPLPDQLPLAAAMSELQNIIRYEIYFLGSFRYLDPPEVKEIYRKRTDYVDLVLRRDLSFSIIVARKFAKDAY